MKSCVKCLLLPAFLIMVLFSCTHHKTSSLKLTGDDTKDIIGIWKGGKKSLWIEFKTDGRYDMGYPSEIREQDQPYKLNITEKILTLQSNKGDKVLSYRFANGFLNLKMQGKERPVILEKIDKRPVK
ncbi:MAG: hypothetical protein NTW49_13240 [Bacteroidia bacterium]|nr:hypothetical protein [Bacteroidia bacterium]